MGTVGTAVWLSFAAAAIIYLMALAVYVILKNQSVSEKSVASVSVSAPPPQDYSTGEITENMHLKDSRPQNIITCGPLAAGFSSLIGGRKYQEDSLHVGVTRSGLLAAIVCDGMGGLKRGADASALATKRLFAYAQDFSASDDIARLLKQAAIDADLDVFDTCSTSNERSGTTAVAVVAVGSTVFWLSVGDSRIYLMRDRQIYQITRDHNYELELRLASEAGEAIPEQERKTDRLDALISYVGMGGLTFADAGKINLEPDDSVLLCSDGLCKALTDQEIAQMLDSFGTNVADCADALATSAVRRGGTRQDNTTVVVIRPVS